MVNANGSHLVYLSLGTNLGDKEANLHAAVNELKKRIGRLVVLSAFYATEPWGFSSGQSFLNAACCMETTLSPFQVLEETQTIERLLGRTKKSVDGQYADRLIDIDLLLFDDLVIDTPTLTIPHPLMHLRDFVLKPMTEIAPDAIHPVLGKKIRHLLVD